jgi:hypothetical protein
MQEQQEPKPPKLFDRVMIAVLVALGAFTIFAVVYLTGQN